MASTVGLTGGFKEKKNWPKKACSLSVNDVMCSPGFQGI